MQTFTLRVAEMGRSGLPKGVMESLETFRTDLYVFL